MDETDPKQQPSPKSTPPILDYNSGRNRRHDPGTSGTGQIFAGFFCWVLAVVATFASLPAQRGVIPANLWWLVPGMMLGLVIWACIWTRIKFGWRGFIPGVLIGLGLTCLVPIGIIAVVCGHP